MIKRMPEEQWNRLTPEQKEIVIRLQRKIANVENLLGSKEKLPVDLRQKIIDDVMNEVVRENAQRQEKLMLGREKLLAQKHATFAKSRLLLSVDKHVDDQELPGGHPTTWDGLRVALGTDVMKAIRGEK